MANKITAGFKGSRRKVILASVALITGALVGGVTTAAYASFSGNGYYTVNGQQDINYAFLWTRTSPVEAYAQTRTGPYSPSTISSGWVGSRGRLFITSTGAMSCEATTSYSNVSLTYPSNWKSQSCTRSSHNSWYSYGVSYSWNGSGYNAWYTYISPSETN